MGKGELAEEVERSQPAHADWGEGRTWHDRTRDWREMCHEETRRAVQEPGVVHHKSDRGAYQTSAELIIVPACEDFTIVGGGAQECFTREVKERPVPSTSRVEEHVGHMKQIHT